MSTGGRVPVLIFCPRCKARADGDVTAEAIANIDAGRWGITCPLCGGWTKITKRDQNPYRPS